MSAGKGDDFRPVDEKKYRANYDKINFSKRKNTVEMVGDTVTTFGRQAVRVNYYHKTKEVEITWRTNPSDNRSIESAEKHIEFLQSAINLAKRYRDESQKKI
jgi:hypothetical protein